MSQEPCNACPWKRGAAKNWLGGKLDAVDWLAVAHSDDTIECHKREGGNHCIGAAIYRANVCKLPAPPNPKAEVDRELVFSNPTEFHEHHTDDPLPPDWVTRRFSEEFHAKMREDEDE